MSKPARASTTDMMSEPKPATWLHEDRPDTDVITDKVKYVWDESRRTAVGKLAQYSIPLYTTNELDKDSHWLKTANHYRHKFESEQSTNTELEARIADQDAEIKALREQVAHLLKENTAFVEQTILLDATCRILAKGEG